VKYQNIAPVNGRELVADDVIKSFQRQVALKINASNLVGLTKMEAPDRGTVKRTLDTPNANFLWSLASVPCKKVMDGTAWIAQVRTDGNFTAYLGAQGAFRPTKTELYDRYHSKSPTPRTMLKDPDLDQLIDQQVAMVKDAAGWARVIQDIHRRIIDNAGFICVGAQVVPLTGRGYVKDWVSNGGANLASEMRLVWLDK
jgi:ABC-type transport system substrate-binding protein